jgi:cytochrome P450
LGTTAADHGRQRRILSHAFSDKALREQEGVLQSYVDLLISRLRDISAKTPEYSNGGDGWDSTGRVELCKWYNGFTFDVISDLCFGEPFGSLRDMKQHSWVGSILEGLKAVKFSYVLHYFPIVKRMGSLIVNPAQIRQRAQLYEWIKEKTETRVATETQRADFITAIMQHQNSRFEGDNSKEADAMRIGELVSNVGLFLVAGTETTATTLSIGSFLLLANPDVLHRLSTETRSRYQTEADITVDSVAHFDYLNAFIHEIMRCYPPVPAGFLRKVPETGAQVAGYNLPGNGNVSP